MSPLQAAFLPPPPWDQLLPARSFGTFSDCDIKLGRGEKTPPPRRKRPDLRAQVPVAAESRC